METEVVLLNAAYIDRSSWEFLTRLGLSNELSPTGKIVWEECCRFYNADDEVESVNIPIVRKRMQREYERHYEMLNHILNQFSNDLSIPNILEEYKDLRQENLGNDLAALLIEPNQLNKNKIEELMLEYQNIGDAVESLHSTPIKFGAHPDEFMEDVLGDNVVKLYPRVLNEKIGGGAPRGSHILVFARPEAGKSLVSINLAYGFCKEGLRTLYIGNEDPASAMWTRLLSRFSGMTKFEVYKNRPAAFNAAIPNGYNNLAFNHMSPGSVGEIERIVRNQAERGEPFDCLIVDQLRNLRANNQNKVEALEENAIGVRGIAQRHNLVAVSITQAGDSAEGRLELTMGDVDYSNTGIPAQVDVMIGVGVTPEWDRGNTRMLSFPKNKLGGDHSGCPVRVFPELSKVVSE